MDITTTKTTATTTKATTTTTTNSKNSKPRTFSFFYIFLIFPGSTSTTLDHHHTMSSAREANHISVEYKGEDKEFVSGVLSSFSACIDFFDIKSPNEIFSMVYPGTTINNLSSRCLLTSTTLKGRPQRTPELFQE